MSSSYIPIVLIIFILCCSCNRTSKEDSKEWSNSRFLEILVDQHHKKGSRKVLTQKDLNELTLADNLKALDEDSAGNGIYRNTHYFAIGFGYGGKFSDGSDIFDAALGKMIESNIYYLPYNDIKDAVVAYGDTFNFRSIDPNASEYKYYFVKWSTNSSEKELIDFDRCDFRDIKKDSPPWLNDGGVMIAEGDELMSFKIIDDVNERFSFTVDKEARILILQVPSTVSLESDLINFIKSEQKGRSVYHNCRHMRFLVKNKVTEDERKNTIGTSFLGNGKQFYSY